MANDAQSGNSSGRRLEIGGVTADSGANEADISGRKRSKRDSSSALQLAPNPPSTRRSARLEKLTAPATPVVPRKSKRLEQQSAPSPLRRSERRKSQGSSTPFGSKTSEKVSSPVVRQKKKERSVEQLTMEAVKVSLSEDDDHKAYNMKRRKTTARSYKAQFVPQRKSCSIKDSEDKVKEIEPPLGGAPEISVSSSKYGDENLLRDEVEPEFAYSGQNLSDKFPDSSEGAGLSGSLIGCTNPEMNDVNKIPKDHSVKKKLQLQELEESTMQKDDMYSKSGEQVLQSKRESYALPMQTEIKNLSSTPVVEAVPGVLSSSDDEYANLNCAGAVCSNSNLAKSKENFVADGSKPYHPKFAEYWVPIPMSNLQLEKYCATLLANSITLCSSLKKDDVGALHDTLMTLRKGCNHPYFMDQSLEKSIMEEFPPEEFLNVGIRASGKLEFLDIILQKIKYQGLRVLLLFQTVGSGHMTNGNILDDFLRQRFGEHSYERIDAGLTPKKRERAMTEFNKGNDQFVLLLEHRACSSSIKLTSVDIVIIFDTEFNPLNDIKDLQRMSIDSNNEPIKVFRLYSCYTVEEKVLILVKNNKNVQNNLQNKSRATSDSLLMWGASILFNRLDEYHAGQSTMPCSDISSWQQSLLDDVVKNFMAIILNSLGNSSEQDPIISRAFISEGVYRIDSLLLGEKEAQLTDGEDRVMYWKKLLEGRNQQWMEETTLRIRKRVHYDENKETGTKRHKVGNASETASTDQPESEGEDQSAVSKFVARRLDKGNEETNCLSEKDSSSNQTDLLQLSDEQRSLHNFLRAEMDKLYAVLKLQINIKHIVETFLDYVMKNHQVNKEPASILQAFQISLCWIAASILKEKIDKGDSLRRAKEFLDFQCTEEEARSVYLKLRLLKKSFLLLPGYASVLPHSPNVASALEGCAKQPPVAGSPPSGSFKPPNVKIEDEERPSSLEPRVEHSVEEVEGVFVDKKMKKVRKRCAKHMYKLRQQHKEEILEKEKEKQRLEVDLRDETDFICATYPETMRADLLKSLDHEFKKKIQEHEATLKELQARHSAELEQHRKLVDDWMTKMMSCITASGPAKEMPTASSDTGEENPDRIVRDDSGAGNVILSGPVVMAADVAIGGVCSETSLCTPGNPVTNEVLDVEQAMTESTTVVEQPEETIQVCHQIQVDVYQEAVGCSLPTETSPPILNSTSVTLLDTANESSYAASAEQLKEVKSLPCTTHDITSNDLATSKEKESCEILSSGQNNEISLRVPGAGESEIGNVSMDIFLEGESGDGEGNSRSSDALGNQKIQTQRSTSEAVLSPQPPAADIVSSLVCENNELQPSDCRSPDLNQVTIEPVQQGNNEGDNSLPTSAASLQMVESSVELLDEAVSHNGETVVTPSIEGMDASHLASSQIEGSSSLPTQGASFQVVEVSVERSNQEAASLNGQTDMLPSSIAGVCRDRVDSHCDLEVVTQTSIPNMELPTESGNSLPPLQAEPNLVTAEGPNMVPVHQMHQNGSRIPNFPLHVEPLQIELETLRKDMDQAAKHFDSTKLLLNRQCEKEIEETVAQIRLKYEAKIKEAESAFFLKKTQLDSNSKMVFMNKILAEAFQSKCLDIRTSANSAKKQAAAPRFIQHIPQVSLQPRLRNLSFHALSSAGQPLSSQQSASSLVESVRRPLGLFASSPARPPEIRVITPSIGNLRVGGEIRAQAPHLQRFRPPACTSAASTSFIPSIIPTQQMLANVPGTSISPPSMPAQQPLPALSTSQFLLPNPPSRTTSVPSHSSINQDTSSNQPSETKNGVEPGRLSRIPAMELLMDVQDQASGHLPNILQHLASSGLNRNAIDQSTTGASGNVDERGTMLATALDVVCLSDDDS